MKKCESLYAKVMKKKRIYSSLSKNRNLYAGLNRENDSDCLNPVVTDGFMNDELLEAINDTQVFIFLFVNFKFNIVL